MKRCRAASVIGHAVVMNGCPKMRSYCSLELAFVIGAKAIFDLHSWPLVRGEKL